MNFPDVRRVATCERLSSLGKGGYAMLIKSADDQGVEQQALEQRAAGKGPDAARAAKELRKRRAGLKGERDSAYMIDFDYASSPNWAVIHDLRLEHGSSTPKIDHQLNNRWTNVYGK